MTPNPTVAIVEDVPTEMQEKFASILSDHGIKDEIDTITMVHPPELKGEHMATATVYVTINFKDATKKPKNLFVKKFTNSELFTKASRDMKIMDKESEFFNKFLPACREFCAKFEGCKDLLHFFPACLYGDENMVVLENHVLDDEFVMLSKEELQDLETAKHVLGNLARFHAVTHSMVDECGGRDAFLSKWNLVCHEPLMTEDNPFVKGMFDNGLNTCLTILKGVSLPDAKETATKITAMIGHTFTGVMKCLAVSPEDKVVLVNHGDCWNNNMLFKIDTNSDGKMVIKEHMFVDLQITRFTSPCVDVTYFLHTSVKSEVRREHLKDLLTHYHSTFSGTLTRFNKKCPNTFEELFSDYKSRAYYGYLSNLNFFAMIGALKELDFENMGGTTPEEMVEGFNRIMNAWIANNPVKSTKMAQGMIDVVKEYGNLMES
ncbi:uncharacterized protein LOC110853285 [Folsomia candida]|uniref:CHK kinase-like domain-containing protein n=1 Tax=Folsomia candida TaxID=158441 RepID=A0A226E0E1_FOLCA|nr:uncharacterized protein LOC110853285 [Folsomia candida]OXA51215.1 hypothetical protein Fcan01_14529 [Folsomia candida]